MEKTGVMESVLGRDGLARRVLYRHDNQPRRSPAHTLGNFHQANLTLGPPYVHAVYEFLWVVRQEVLLRSLLILSMPKLFICQSRRIGAARLLQKY